MHKHAKFCTARRCLEAPVAARPFCSRHWLMIELDTRALLIRLTRAGHGADVNALLRSVRERLELRDLERGAFGRSQGAAAHV